MQGNYPKISVIVITYNQEDVISRAVNSVMIQKEYLHELIICDDCSKDFTWEIILNHVKAFPSQIRAFRNEKNLGIFGNIKSTWSRPTGNIIIYLAGDDVLCDGLLKAVVDLIRKNNIDVETESFTLYFDFKIVSPSGKETIKKNNFLLKSNDAVDLKIRGLISNRTTAISKKVLEQFTSVDETIGIYADGLIDIQTQMYSLRSYYCPFVGSVYYAGLGIASRTDEKSHVESFMMLMDHYLRMFGAKSKKTVNWIRYSKQICNFKCRPTLGNWLLSLYFFIGGLDLTLGNEPLRNEVIHLLKLSIRIFRDKKKTS